jgi:hypothetical protein
MNNRAMGPANNWLNKNESKKEDTISRTWKTAAGMLYFGM